MKSLIFGTVFWLASSLVAYVYIGYPLLLALFCRRRNGPLSSNEALLPRVTLLISAYNERGVIKEKLCNSLALDYPRDLFEVIVISDCSDDGTDEIVAQYAMFGVRLVRQSQRLGKSAGLNLGVRQATGEILVFSDANAIYQSDAIRQLVGHFADPRVGYVVGNARYTDTPGQPASAESEGLYWKLETWLKRKESEFGSVVGGDGAIYAIRREFFTPLRPTDINDFLNPLQIIARGHRGVFEPAAVCYEEAGDSFAKEFRRKVRIVSRSLNAISRAPGVLLPWTQPRHWFALISHKLLRWFVPFFLILSLCSSLALWSRPFYKYAALLQLVFYSLALGGLTVVRRHRSIRIFYLPYYFCVVNLASLIGIMKSFRGSLSPTWQTVRHDSLTQLDPPVRFAKRER